MHYPRWLAALPRALLLFAIAASSTTALAQRTDPGEVLYRARTNVQGERIGVEIKIIDPLGIDKWSAYSTTVEPVLRNQFEWEDRDCSETEVDAYLDGSELATRTDLVIGHVSCGQNPRVSYWSLSPVDGAIPTDWRAADRFIPAALAAGGTDENAGSSGDQVNVLQGGMAIWIRSAAVLAGFATVAIIGFGYLLYRRTKTIEEKVEARGGGGSREGEDRNRGDEQ